jgi:hypothetical protein
MNEIVQQIVQRAGIPEDKARMAVEVVMGQLEKQLPAPIAAQVRSYLAGGGQASGGQASGGQASGGQASGGLGDIARGLGGMFGKK